METLARGLSYIDLGFQRRPRVIATAVLDDADGVALVDPGPSTCLEALRRALRERGLDIGDIRTLLLTHIHLDHAGASGSLLQENPDVTVYVHERGAPHLIDPERLLASAARLYGSDMDRLWGAVRAVPKANVRPLAGGERLAIGERQLDVIYTPGHASHHVCYFDRSSGVAFVGDMGGIRPGREVFAMPPTPPPDIDVEAWKDSVGLIRAWRPTTLFTTHFGPHEDPDAHLDAVLQHLEAMKAMALEILKAEEINGDEDRQRIFVERMRVYLQRHLPPVEAVLYDVAAPLAQCWLGLARYWRKRGIEA